ncbi:MAG TPA: Xaa-Pro dipeptidase [Thermoanaerobaculia bacterium]|nr:Xaa-Pro dipeptidase [Thermoanaerobaculia bacterium]
MNRSVSQDKLASLYPAHLATMKSRHDAALESTGYDHIVIFGGSEHIAFLDDNAYPFRVSPLFKAWLPVTDNPNCFIVHTPGKRPQLLYFQPVDYWYKPAEDPEGYWVGEFDLHRLAKLEDAKAFIPSGRVAFAGEWDPSFGNWNLTNPNPQPLINRLHYDRAWKTEYEIECMRQANLLAARGHRAAERAFREGASEYEIHLQYMRATNHKEAELPYGNIIAFNEHAAVLHYQHQERERPKDVHSFLIDAGATFHGYASDITRTWSKENDEFAELIASVDAYQQELCAAVRPGLDYREFHLLAHRKAAETLKKHGFITVGADEAVETGITSAFFPHGLGHYIGLQVHDVGGFMSDTEGNTIDKPEGHPYLRLTRVVEPGHVFTVEPGIYFIGSLLEELKNRDGKGVEWAKVDAFRKYGGVRIEDDVVVREERPENLTRAAFAAG